MGQKRISVIVPAYNAEKYIGRCLDSLTGQTYKDLEIIVVDDGSKDRTGIICDQYAEKDSRIQVVHQDNRGVSQARNVGLSRATGDYIGFMDSDDYIDPKMYQSMQSRMTDGIDVVVCNFSEGEKIYYSGKQELCFDRVTSLANLLTNSYFTCSLCSKLFRRQLLSGLSFDPKIVHNEDLLFVYLAFKKCRKLIFTPDVYYFYCQNEGSAVRSPFDKKKMGIILVHTYILEDIQKSFPTLYPLARKEFVRNNITCVQLAVASGYSDKQDIRLMKRNIRKNLMFYVTSDASKGYKIYAILISVNHRLLKLLP